LSSLFGKGYGTNEGLEGVVKSDMDKIDVLLVFEKTGTTSRNNR
jgi:hypothetical protein